MLSLESQVKFNNIEVFKEIITLEIKLIQIYNEVKTWKHPDWLTGHSPHKQPAQFAKTWVGETDLITIL